MLNFEDRKKLERLYLENKRLPDIAAELNVSLVTVYRELNKGDAGVLDVNGRPAYSAVKAQQVLISNLRRKGKGKRKAETAE